MSATAATPIYDQVVADLGIDPDQVLADIAHEMGVARTLNTWAEPVTPHHTRPIRKVTP